jgi:tetratricopeptide (TPR) repeat protein
MNVTTKKTTKEEIMKPVGKILLIALFACSLLVLTIASSLFAQEEKVVDEIAELRKENEALRQQVQELLQQLEDLKEHTLQLRDREKAEQLKAEDTRKKADELQAEAMMMKDRRREEVQALAEERMQALQMAIEQMQKQYEEKAVKVADEKLKSQRDAVVRALEDARRKYKAGPDSKAQSMTGLPNPLDQVLAALDMELSKQIEDFPKLLDRQTQLSKRAGNLDKAILARDDAGLLLQLRFEKVQICRQLGRTDEAIAELRKIIEENPDELSTPARWTLIEILQEKNQQESVLAELKAMLETAKDPGEKRNAIYAILSLAGDDPEAKLEWIDKITDWLSESKEKAKRTACRTNLLYLKMAIDMYSLDHGDRFKELSDLYPTYVKDFQIFTCPTAEGAKISRQEDIDEKSSYIFRKGLPESPPDAWVLCEKPSNHGGEGGHVLLSNGEVKWLDAADLKGFVEKIREEKLPTATDTSF